MQARTWRKEPIKSALNTSWRLVAGRGKDRVRLGLGIVSEDDADRALQTMQREETDTVGTPHYDRVLRLADKDKAAAVAFLLEGNAAEEIFGPLPVDYGGMRLTDYFDQVYEPHRSSSRPASWKSEVHFWRNINGALGRHRLRELASADGAVVIDGFLADLRRQDKRPASTATKRLHRAAIRGLFTFARRKNHVSAIPEFFTIERDPDNPGRGPSATLTAEERDAVIDKEPDLRLRTLWTIATHLGCRPAENAGLRWEDVAWDERGRSFHGALFVRGSKTEASRARVPLVGPCRPALLEWWVACGQPAEGIIFPATGAGEPYQSNTTYSAALRSACARAGVTKKITPYSLRHTAATLAKRAGVSTDTVAKLLRHTNPRMVEQRYDHTGAVDAPDLDLLGGR